MTEWREKARAHAEARRKGMAAERKKQLSVINEAHDDWVAKCRKCGKVLTGTLAQLREHVCDH